MIYAAGEWGDDSRVLAVRRRVSSSNASVLRRGFALGPTDYVIGGVTPP